MAGTGKQGEAVLNPLYCAVARERVGGRAELNTRVKARHSRDPRIRRTPSNAQRQLRGGPHGKTVLGSRAKREAFPRLRLYVSAVDSREA